MFISKQLPYKSNVRILKFNSAQVYCSQYCFCLIREPMHSIYLLGMLTCVQHLVTTQGSLFVINLYR